MNDRNQNGREDAGKIWPALPYDARKGTYDTLHMLAQVVGKVQRELCPYGHV